MQQGVVAQLGERLLDVQEVCGSSPHGPTGYRCTAAIFIWPLYLARVMSRVKALVVSSGEYRDNRVGRFYPPYSILLQV